MFSFSDTQYLLKRMLIVLKGDKNNLIDNIHYFSVLSVMFSKLMLYWHKS